MSISVFVFWAVIVGLALQVIYNLDGWRIYGQSHRGMAAGSCGLILLALLMDGLA